jgi:hypothetical protein
MKKLFCVLTILVLLGSLALPAFAAEADTGAVIVPGPDLMLEFFPALFEGLTSIFQSPPMLYLFGIFVLAFIVLIFKLIFHF